MSLEEMSTITVNNHSVLRMMENALVRQRLQTARNKDRDRLGIIPTQLIGYVVRLEAEAELDGEEVELLNRRVEVLAMEQWGLTANGEVIIVLAQVAVREASVDAVVAWFRGIWPGVDLQHW